MRRSFLGLAVALAIVVLAPPGGAYAQLGGNLGSDPFSLYYGYYLPHAAAIAAQPTPMDTINQNALQRQYAAQTDRSTLYDPISPYGDEELDPLSPYSGRKGLNGRPRSSGFGFENASQTARGGGPSMYYNRTARYFPTLRIGRGPNQNLAKVKVGRGAGGGMPAMSGIGGNPGGMGGMSMPGPR